jgi:type IV pilus assembly protein PilN
MAHINLLPWREELRKQRQKEFGVIVIIALLVMGGIVGAVHLQIQAMIQYQEARNTRLDQEIAALDQKIKEIKDLEKEKENLIARMRIVEQLQTSRPEVVHLFDELVNTVPEGIYLTRLEQKGRSITIDGYAQSNARVSSFMRALDGSEWLESPDLVRIQAVKRQGRDFGGMRLSEFSLKVSQSQPRQEGAEEG